VLKYAMRKEVLEAMFGKIEEKVEGKLEWKVEK
jgi:hypothetical protein